MPDRLRKLVFELAGREREPRTFGIWASAFLGFTLAAVFCSLPARAGYAQEASSGSVSVVQPGAPGTASRRLPASTSGEAPQSSQADIAFMQGMIMHHAQAVEMTALISSHTENREIRTLGARISLSQTDEIKFMKRWLVARGAPVSMAMPEMPGTDSSNQLIHAMPEMPGADSSNQPSHAMPEMPGADSSNQPSHAMPEMPGMANNSQPPRPPMHTMPGMLTLAQMDALRQAKGAEFDQRFLTGMIRHHKGALVMVQQLFDTPGAGQDADLFDFATDADNTQRAEIRIMEDMLKEKR
jgi:uncharacterized protein (DUF305 family)